MFGHDNDKEDEIKDQSAANAGDQQNNDWQHPGTPLNDDSSSDAASADGTDEPGEDETPAPEVTETPAASHEPRDLPTGGSHSANDLIDLKQQALTKLSPLVDHLDQGPDDKFRTLMMMIQASDDQALVKEAYETALKIDDEKERAQALLDIVNEINYFTQNPAKSE